MRKLTICIPTYNRNAELADLLGALQIQTLPSSHRDISILVIDNNPDGGAAGVVKTALQSPFKIEYIQEHRPGVVYVRNTALEHCYDRDDLVFIDDDECPSDSWLHELCKRQEETGASIVFGSVEAKYLSKVPEWISGGDFHSNSIASNSVSPETGATGNCLIDMSLIRQYDVRFDETLSLIGGEDTLFFDSLLKLGVPMANASKAVTYEMVPKERATLPWLSQRWRRTGYTDALIVARRKGKPLKTRAAVNGLIRLVVSTPMSFLTRLFAFGRMTAAVAKWNYTRERGLGMLSYARGHSIEEYARHTEV